MRTPRRVRAISAGLLAVVLAVGSAGCTPATSAPPTPISTQLEALPVIARPPADDTYRRAYFGKAWTDTDGSNCRQRADVLYRDVDRSRPFTTRRSGRCTHEMVSGTWQDPYTGEVRTFSNLRDPVQAQQLPIDHVVALAVFWRYGASSWTDQQRLVAANDLDNLIPTTAHVNASKGGKDAASWRPPKRGQCEFAHRYITVKARYQLAVDTSEKAALQEMLATC